MVVPLSALIGVAAGCIGLYSFVPQVMKCCRSGETAAISLRMFALRIFGLVLWTIYGFALGSLPVLIFSALGLVVSSVIVVLKVRGARSQPTDEPCRDAPQRSVSGTAAPASRRVPDHPCVPATSGDAASLVPIRRSGPALVGPSVRAYGSSRQECPGTGS
jgi:MtN3 and saliva related transmembrane protein